MFWIFLYLKNVMIFALEMLRRAVQEWGNQPSGLVQLT